MWRPRSSGGGRSGGPRPTSRGWRGRRVGCEGGVGRTVAARAAVAALEASRHTVIYLANPAVGARGSTRGQLEELRLLANAEMNSESPFAGILLGQPTLRRRRRLGSFAALDQRVALRYEVPGMEPPRAPPASPTTWRSPAARIRSSRTTRRRSFTRPAAACRAF